MARRSRFTVTVSPTNSNEIRREVALCFSAASARSFFEGRGFVVLQVEAGDYRKAERAAAARASGGFRIDREALAAAIELLGLTLPVKIRFTSRVGNVNGNYRLHASGYHDIMLKSYRTTQQASETLWHELTHAMQAERFQRDNPHLTPRTAWLAQLQQSKGKYKRCPLEIEARRMARDMADLPLTVSR